MKLWISNSVRVALGKKYLDWAEKLPRFGRGTISSLQLIREHQRRRAEEAHKNTRSPQGTEIEFLYFRLMEIFHIEEFEKLRDGVLQLFPVLETRFPPKDFLADFSSYAATISGGGYWTLGVIMRQVKGRVVVDPCREIPELPTDVDIIDVNLHKILPSIFIVALDVHLTEEATRNLVQLQSSVVFHKYIDISGSILYAY